MYTHFLNYLTVLERPEISKRDDHIVSISKTVDEVPSGGLNPRSLALPLSSGFVLNYRHRPGAGAPTCNPSTWGG